MLAFVNIEQWANQSGLATSQKLMKKFDFVEKLMTSF